MTICYQNEFEDGTKTSCLSNHTSKSVKLLHSSTLNTFSPPLPMCYLSSFLLHFRFFFFFYCLISDNSLSQPPVIGLKVWPSKSVFTWQTMVQFDLLVGSNFDFGLDCGPRHLSHMLLWFKPNSKVQRSGQGRWESTLRQLHSGFCATLLTCGGRALNWSLPAGLCSGLHQKSASHLQCR